MRERRTVMLNSAVQSLMGCWAEPIAGRVARDSLGYLTGKRSVKRMGLHWQLDMRQNHERALYLVGSYERSVVFCARRLLRYGGTVLDVGANIGTFALPLAMHGIEVIAIEPASDSYERLVQHIKMNKLASMVMPQKIALGSKAGSVELRSGCSDDSGLRSLVGEGEIIERVKMISGDELLGRGSSCVSLIKLDVEGVELDVLEGLSGSLESVRAVIVEVVGDNQSRSGRTGAEIGEFLSDHGFVERDLRFAEPRPRLGRGGCNSLFLRRAKTVGR